jgi:5-(carboxyamino)imidazole ribonucleotide mutase
MPRAAKPIIGLIMGSVSDWPTLEPGAQVLKEFGVPFEHRVVSAHRTPKLLYDYATSARGRGLRCIIAAAGGAAHLPGMTAALTPLPVLGVPVRTKSLDGLDSLLSIAQMPAGIPVATFRIGSDGAIDAAHFAIRFLAAGDAKLRARYRAYLRRKSRPRA